MAIADDASALLAKARSAFERNTPQDRYWIWSAVTKRSVIDKDGKLLEELPSVTIETLIRPDGRRCNAVTAWGDGLAPFLENASAEERCQVLEEIPSVLQIPAILEKEHAKVQSIKENEITLAIRPDKRPAGGTDEVKRCAGAIQGTIVLDKATAFPKRVNLTVTTNACWMKPAPFEEHYLSGRMMGRAGLVKGTHIESEYELQKDKTGDASRDFWISVHRVQTQAVTKGMAFSISGRLLKLTSTGPDRQMVVETNTAATEVSAESTVKFEIPK